MTNTYLWLLLVYLHFTCLVFLFRCVFFLIIIYLPVFTITCTSFYFTHILDKFIEFNEFNKILKRENSNVKARTPRIFTACNLLQIKNSLQTLLNFALNSNCKCFRAAGECPSSVKSRNTVNSLWNWKVGCVVSRKTDHDFSFEIKRVEPNIV